MNSKTRLNVIWTFPLNKSMIIHHIGQYSGYHNFRSLSNLVSNVGPLDQFQTKRVRKLEKLWLDNFEKKPDRESQSVDDTNYVSIPWSDQEDGCSTRPPIRQVPQNTISQPSSSLIVSQTWIQNQYSEMNSQIWIANRCVFSVSQFVIHRLSATSADSVLRK